MDDFELEYENAWMELSFWRDFAVWWSEKHSKATEPRIVEALENAERRYAEAGLWMSMARASNNKRGES